MRSAASLHGHPIHPMVIPFPFAFLFGSVALDLLARVTGRERWGQTAATLQSLGLGAALLAAVPGLVDYLVTVPPESSAKKRATRHMLSNLGAVGLFAAARATRGSEGPAGNRSLGLAAAGAALMSVGGWLGGTLVYRNQIGVDTRYAGAGRWKESTATLEAGRPIVLGTTDELEVDQMKLVHVGDRRIVLARTNEGYVAFHDRCTHRGGSLAGGTLVKGTVQCPWHGSQFASATGRVERGPAEDPIETYRVDEIDGELRIELPDQARALPG